MDFAKKVFSIAKEFYDEHELLSITCDFLEKTLKEDDETDREFI